MNYELVKNISDKKTTKFILRQSARTRWEEIKTFNCSKISKRIKAFRCLIVADQTLK
ncbi:hypothetical protein [Gottfriedia solisilvae]|nr:hypothetical protein [Gottfriedia solisilvae]